MLYAESAQHSAASGDNLHLGAAPVIFQSCDIKPVLAEMYL